MDIEDNMTDLRLLLAERKKLNEAIDEMKRQICMDHHPLAVGDLVDINGWTHKGKKMRVSDIYLKDMHAGRFSFSAIGVVMKANGDSGANRANWTDKVDGECNLI